MLKDNNGVLLRKTSTTFKNPTLGDKTPKKKKINAILDDMVGVFKGTPLGTVDDGLCCGLPYIIDETGYVCKKCGVLKSKIIDSSTSIFEPRVIKASYDRSRHFYKILMQLQGREVFNMREFDKIKKYIDDNQIKDLSTDNIKNILKELKLSNYYLHIQLVRRHLGCEMIIMSDELIDKLMFLFRDVQRQMNLHRNFPPYHYILKRLFIYLGDDRFMHLLRKLKNENKVAKVLNKVSFFKC